MQKILDFFIFWLLGDERELMASMKARPVKTLLKITLVVLASLLFVAIVAFVSTKASNIAQGDRRTQDKTSVHLTSGIRQLCNGFSKTVYSNSSPVDSDIINLCNAGTLRPAMNVSGDNIRLGGAERGEKPYDNSTEVLMILNLIKRGLGTTDFGTMGSVELQALADPKPEDYLLFNAGTEREITTSGRTFIVRLQEINREPTKNGVPYFSYHFIINEK